MFRFLSLIVVALCMIPPVAFANNEIADQYYFPVVASADGVNHTTWKTELCLETPWERHLEILVMVVDNGDIVDFDWVHLSDNFETVCISDVLPEMFGLSGSASILLYAREEDNTHTSNLLFVPSVRVYNLAGNGETFGQEIAPVNLTNDLGALVHEDDVGLFTGIQNYGSSTGFRTNIGFSTISDSPQTIEVLALDEDGYYAEGWEVTLQGYDQFQFRIPQDVVIRGGAILVSEGYLVAPYVSVVDNKSGDGLFRGMIKFDGSKSLGQSLASRLIESAQAIPARANGD